VLAGRDFRPTEVLFHEAAMKRCFLKGLFAKPRRPRVFISVIIPAHNEEEFLPATLEALRKQTYPSFEIIVVTNGCTDRTADVVRGKCDQLYELEKRGLGPARNLGGEKARGDLLLFLDADTLLEPGALTTIAAHFTRRHASGTLKGCPDTARPSYKMIYFFKNLIHKTHAHHGSSGVILCWRDQFRAVGGFDNDLYLRENSDLMKKLRRFGSYTYIRATPAVTSMRRYDKAGVGEMLLLWLKVWVLSNFSDIRHQTYEGMAGRRPEISRAGAWLVEKIEKRREALRTRNAHAT
jgi:glycosyltransferase involved in cell wall biosynthesis